MFLKNPSTLDKPWILSKPDENEVSIPVEVTRHLSNYHMMGVEFLYHNYRKGIKGSVLNEEPKMNLPLQLSAFFRAVVRGPALILILCSRQSSCYWHYHLVNHAKFDVIRVSSKNSTDSYGGDSTKLALIATNDNLKLCEDLVDHDFFSVVIEDLDQFAIKRVIKRLSGNFNVGLTHRSFYTDPDQKLQWSMLNWANPGCVGKLNEFYEIDNRNLENFEDNYRYWWLRLTWRFCDSFQEPTSQELEVYEQTVSEWASANSLIFHHEKKRKTRKRKAPKVKPEENSGDSSDKTVINEVPMDKYVELPKLDETPIVTSIIKNLETSPEPILTRTEPSSKKLLPCTLTSYDDEKSVIFSFLEDEAMPSTSRSASEDFIINLIQKPESKEAESGKITDILKEADALLQN